MEIRTVSVIGLGALGVLFGEHLAGKMEKGTLRIVADRARIEKYEEEKVYSNGKAVDFHYVTPEEKTGPSDLVIFAVKYGGLKDAVEAMRNQVGPDTVIISTLNGISSEGVIAEAFGMDRVVYCVAQGMDALKVGNHLTYRNMGMLCFGPLKAGESMENTERLAAFFEKVGLPYLVDQEMGKRMWGKFMLNVGVNQTVAVYGGNYGTVQNEGEARETMIAAMREVIALSGKEGVELGEEDLAYWLKVMGTLRPEGKPSMAQDMDARRRSEVELFAGAVLELGRKYDIETPVNAGLYQKVMEMEKGF